MLLLGALGGYALRAGQRPAEVQACTLGLKVSLDAALRFDEKRALADAAAMGRLASSIEDREIRDAARAFARDMSIDLSSDDVDDRIANKLAALHKACENWHR